MSIFKHFRVQSLVEKIGIPLAEFFAVLDTRARVSLASHQRHRPHGHLRPILSSESLRSSSFSEKLRLRFALVNWLGFDAASRIFADGTRTRFTIV